MMDVYSLYWAYAVMLCASAIRFGYSGLLIVICSNLHTHNTLPDPDQSCCLMLLSPCLPIMSYCIPNRSYDTDGTTLRMMITTDYSVRGMKNGNVI